MDKNIASKIANLVGNVCIGYKGSMHNLTPAVAEDNLKKFLESLEIPVISENVTPTTNDFNKVEVANFIEEKLVKLQEDFSNTITTLEKQIQNKDEIIKNCSDKITDLSKKCDVLADLIKSTDNHEEETVIKVNVYRGVEYDEDGKNIIATYSRAKVPSFKHKGDSGADVYVCFDDNTKPETFVGVAPGTVVQVPLGISCDIPEGYEIQLRPRSGESKYGHCAILGTIDSKYRGVLKANIANISTEPFMINEGDRLGQLVLKRIENVEYTMVDGTINTNTERGTKGFGSSGKRD